MKFKKEMWGGEVNQGIIDMWVIVKSRRSREVMRGARRQKRTRAKD